MSGIVRDEIVDQSVELGGREPVSLCLEPALEHEPCAAADHVARGLVRDRRQSLAAENHVQGGNQVGCGVDQRPVEIEHYGGNDHSRFASRCSREWQGAPSCGATHRLL